MDLPPLAGDELRRSFSAKKSIYRAWVDTIPRSKSINDRYRELIRLDIEHDDLEATLEDSGGVDLEAIESAEDINAGKARVSAIQISRRCSSAIQDARANGADKAAEQLTEIKNIADKLQEID